MTANYAELNRRYNYGKLIYLVAELLSNNEKDLLKKFDYINQTPKKKNCRKRFRRV